MRRSPLAAQGGFTMVEMTMAMALMTVVLTIATQGFIALWDEHRTTTEHNAAQDQSRMAVDRLARNLRNLASPTTLRTITANRPRAIDRAGAFEIVFRNVDERRIPAGSANSANLMRTRYCLNSTDPENGKLYAQEQRWTSAVTPVSPSGVECPAAGWNSTVMLAQNITNNRDSTRPRALFTFNSNNLEQITRVRTDLFVDTTPGARPAEARLATGVLLRNQNQFPEAGFKIFQLGTEGPNRVLRFDASASRDPEGQALKYCWYVDPPGTLPDCNVTPKPASYVGEGVVFTYKMAPGSHTVVLRVEDPAGLQDEAEVTS